MARMGQKPCRCILDHMRLGFVRIGVADHKAGIRVRQVKSEEVDLALYAPDDADGFTKVCLSMPRRMSAFTGMLSAIDRNHCPPSNGMPVRHHRNTQGGVKILILSRDASVLRAHAAAR